MTTETMRDVLAETVEIEGSLFVATRPRGHVSGTGNDYHLGGGYVVGVRRYTTGTAEVELRECGMDTLLHAGSFDSYEDARNEFERLKSVLMLRDRVKAVVDMLFVTTGVLPTEFLPAIKAGELASLLVAADYRDDEGEADKATILRAAYYRLTGQANVVVKATKKTAMVFNPQVVTKRQLAGRNSTNLGELTACVVTPGESVRVVSLDTNKFTPTVMLVKEYRVGDQAEFDSFNLSYHGPILSITAKTVVIDKRGNPGETARMSLAAFAERNHDFDLAAARKRNDEYMD